jgi:hypothetical protein
MHRDDFADEPAAMDVEHLPGGLRGVPRDDPVAGPALSGVHRKGYLAVQPPWRGVGRGPHTVTIVDSLYPRRELPAKGAAAGHLARLSEAKSQRLQQPTQIDWIAPKPLVSVVTVRPSQHLWRRVDLLAAHCAIRHVAVVMTLRTKQHCYPSVHAGQTNLFTR